MTEQDNTFTLDEAMDIIENLRGPEGLLALDEAIDAAVSNRKTQISTLQGEIKGFLTVKRLVGAIADRSGLSKIGVGKVPVAIKGMTPQAEIDRSAVQEITEEVRMRIANKQCSYKAPSHEGGKWCSRALTSKEEQEHGYCEVHLVAMGFRNGQDDTDEPRE